MAGLNICIIHGYRLVGTGSNIFVNNLARYLVKRGQNIIIMCQEPYPDNIDYVNEAYFFNGDNDEAELKFSRKTGYRGSCAVFVPNLNRRLLVYVYDKYDGFDYVNTFQEANAKEIKEYIDRNIKALKSIVQIRSPDILHANHSIMQPYIACMVATGQNIPFITTVHGSALNFSVRNNKFLHRFAYTGLSSSEIIVSVSRHNSTELEKYFRSTGDRLNREIKIIPAGIDLKKFDIFGFKNNEDKAITIKKLIARLKGKIDVECNGAGEKIRLSNKKFTESFRESSSCDEAKEYFVKEYESYESLHTDTDTVDIIRKIDFINQNILLFVGKYIWTKGIQALITALPAVFSKNPETQALMVGFGRSRGILQSLVYTLAGGSTKYFKYLIDHHIQIDPGSKAQTTEVCRLFLDDLENKGKLDKYFETAKKLNISEKIHFTGIMTHEELRYLIPLADVFVAPSIFTEAFGTVAIEALACGILPVITYDYGFREVHDTIYNEPEINNSINLKKLAIDVNFVNNLSGNINSVLDFKERKDYLFRKRCRDIATSHYSWESIAGSYEDMYKRCIGKKRKK